MASRKIPPRPSGKNINPKRRILGEIFWEKEGRGEGKGREKLAAVFSFLFYEWEMYEWMMGHIQSKKGERKGKEREVKKYFHVLYAPLCVFGGDFVLILRKSEVCLICNRCLKKERNVSSLSHVVHR